MIPASTNCASTSAATSSISSLISKASSSISNIPASSLLISSTSLTSSSRCLVESRIFSRLSSTFSQSLRFLRMISTIPMIPLIGVRISWLIRFINSVFALFAASASSNAICRRSFSCCSFSWKSEVFLNRMIPCTTLLSLSVFASYTVSLDIRTVFCNHIG